MKTKPFAPFLACALCMAAFVAVFAADEPRPAENQSLTSSQKAAANAIVSKLLTVEKSNGPGMFLPLYTDKVDDLAGSSPWYFKKIPDGRLKRYLKLAVQAHVDSVTVINECAKYRYYDLIKNQQTPKIIQKYKLQLSLQSTLPYQQLDPKTVSLVETQLWAIAAAARDRAQGLLR